MALSNHFHSLRHLFFFHLERETGREREREKSILRLSLHAPHEAMGEREGERLW